MKYYEIDVMHEVTLVPGILSNCLTSNTINYSKFALVWKVLFWICVSWVLISDDILRLLYKCTNFKTLKNNNNPCRNRYKQFWILCITKLKCLSLYLFIYLDIPKRRNFKISFRTWEYSTKLREFKNDVFIFLFSFYCAWRSQILLCDVAL